MKHAFVLFVFLATAIGMVGCADPELIAGAQVAGESVKDTIIRQIGELEVKRQEVQNAVDAAREEVERLKAVETANVVESQLLQEEIAEMEEEIAKKEREMEQLVEWIETGESVVLKDGTTITIEDMQQYAEQAIQQYDVLNSTLSIKQQTLAIYEDNISMAHSRSSEGGGVITELEGQLELIDAQLDALRVFEEKPELLVDGKGINRDVIADAQTLTDETQTLLEKEIQIRKITNEFVESADNKIEQALQEETGAASNVLEQLRERTEEQAGDSAEEPVDTESDGESP